MSDDVKGRNYSATHVTLAACEALGAQLVLAQLCLADSPMWRDTFGLIEF
ncbi:MAG: hypothetical protein ACI9NT_001801 [Bacteroidia bacterium]|jgi:hypothetical protein